MRSHFSRGALLALVLVVASCGRTLPVTPAESMDAGPDGSMMGDARVDMPRDAQPDGMTDMRLDMPDMVDMPMMMAGIVVAPTTGLTTTETGGTASFTIRLAAAPTSSVTIALTSSDTGEGTVSPVSVTFTTINWNAPQTVVVTGIDDAVGDGSIDYTIITAPAVSMDDRYSGMNASDVSVRNTDDETAGITVSPTSGLVTTEAGGTATFTVVLNTPPTADVSIALSSSNVAEGHVSPATVEFTTLSWSSPVTVTVTGVDDSSADGDQPYQVTVGPASSSDMDYNALSGDSVDVTNLDDEMPGVLVSPTSGLMTTEVGGTASFNVVLRSQPSADVMIALSISDASEGLLSTPTVSFTTDTWNIPQSVTVTGQDDAIADGDQLYTVTVGPSTSMDGAYDGLTGDSVELTNNDNESPGITATSPAGLNTTESGGTATFTVVLDSMPSADVILDISSSNTAEGTASPASITFTGANWNTPQIITLTGVDDLVADGTQPFTITVHVNSSADPDYASLPDVTVGANNVDNETPSITVTPTLGLLTNESGGSSSFSIVLSSMPTADVTIALTSDTPSEGSVSPASVTLTAGDWNAPHVVTVTGVDDAVADGARVFQIITAPATSADMNYNGQDPSDVEATNSDNDIIGITVSPGSIVAAEGGAAGTFTVVLTSEPTADVVVPLGILDSAQGMVSPASLAFTVGDWNVPQTVSVTAVDDLVADGTAVNTVLVGAAASMDVGYNGFDASDVMVTHPDNDVASVVVSPTSGLVTSESGGSSTFTLTLTSQPVADVTIPISSGTTTEGNASPASVTFTAMNWNVPQTVTVTGVNDSIVDGTVAYTVVTGAAISMDLAYNAVMVSDVSATNTDNDTGGFTVSPTSGLNVAESGTTATFTVVLAVQSTADVTISLTSSDTSEATVSPATLTFTALNWNVPQTVTVTGVADGIMDNDQFWTILTGTSVSTLSGYNGINPSDVSGVTNDTDQQRVVSADNSYVARGGFGSPQGLTAAVSTTGRYVVFLSNASNLVAGDTNGSTDVFVRDRTAGTVARVNLTSAGAESTIGCSAGYASISADGRYVVMSCNASDMVAGDANGQYDVYVRDTTAGTTTRVSVADMSGTELTGYSITPSISSDGRYVAFVSNANNAVAGDTNAIQDVFVRDTVMGTTVRANLTTASAQMSGSGTINGVQISANGRYVAMGVVAALDAADTNAVSDVYVRDLMAGTTTRVSVATGGAQGTAASSFPSIVPDGRYVTFQSTATNLVTGDANATSDVFVRDTMMATTTRVSVVTGTAAEGNGSSANGAVSDDGRYIAFTSLASNLVVSDTDGFADLFVRDTSLGTTKLVSRTLMGGLPNAAVLLTYAISIAGNGSIATFSSNATNLTSNDLNVTSDVFAVAAP